MHGDLQKSAPTIVKTIGSWSARRRPPSLPLPALAAMDEGFTTGTFLFIHLGWGAHQI